MTEDRQEEIKTAMREVMRVEMAAFYIDREEHYQHHQFIKSLKSGVEGCQSIIGKVTLTAFIGGIITVMLIGIVGWIKRAIG